MTCAVETTTAGRRPGRLAKLWHKFSIAFSRRGSSYPGAFDPRDLSDHLRRDIGFLDGRPERGEAGAAVPEYNFREIV